MVSYEVGCVDKTLSGLWVWRRRCRGVKPAGREHCRGCPASNGATWERVGVSVRRVLGVGPPRDSCAIAGASFVRGDNTEKPTD